MASSSNFPKGEGLAEVHCRQDPSEVGTLSGRVSPLSRPYPPRYRAAFACSDIVYPLSHLPPLRSGYHRCGGRGAYPVADREERGRSGWDLCSGGIDRMSPPHRRVGQSDPRTVLVPACQPLEPVRLYGALCGPSLTFNRKPPFPGPPPRRGWQGRAIVPGASDVGLLVRPPG